MIICNSSREALQYLTTHKPEFKEYDTILAFDVVNGRQEVLKFPVNDEKIEFIYTYLLIPHTRQALELK